MKPRTLWKNDPVFIEVGVRDAGWAVGLREAGYSKYLGVSGDAARIAGIQSRHPELAEQFVHSERRKVVLNNNAEVLILSGRQTLHLWRYRYVRHAQWVAWNVSFNPYSLVALLGCLCHMIVRRYSRPRVVTLRGPNGKSRSLYVSRVRRQKVCRSGALHFIPHGPGLAGTFRQFDERGVRYAVLRWFESLPEIEPTGDVDLLVDDRSLDDALAILAAQPGVLPCDVYSESGLARSAYRGTPYYPTHVARRILDGAVRSNDLCQVPNTWDYFHSLAYHAVYHKGPRGNLPLSGNTARSNPASGHDFVHILGDMAARLSIDVESSLEALHAYLQESGWGPSPEMLARLAVADRRNEWLQTLAGRLTADVHDQGLAVFVLREQAVAQGFQEQITEMIRQSGFDVLATRPLAAQEVEYAAARTRGGNWEAHQPQGGFDRSGGPPAVVVVAYDRAPIRPNRKQHRRFPQRTNARIFVKESIRDAIIAQLPPNQSFNALHSSDHAAEAWHLIEVLAPELVDKIRARLREIHEAAGMEHRLVPAA